MEISPNRYFGIPTPINWMLNKMLRILVERIMDFGWMRKFADAKDLSNRIFKRVFKKDRKYFIQVVKIMANSNQSTSSLNLAYSSPSHP